MNLGYTIVGNGWDFGASGEDDGMTIQVPIARNRDGSSITGPSYEYINFDDGKSVRYELTYPAATRDKSKATLTVRARLDDPPANVPESGWEYVDDKTIRLLPSGTPFRQSHVYEFIYTAKDPVVAATRARRHARSRLLSPSRGEGRGGQREPAGRRRAQHVQLLHLTTLAHAQRSARVRLQRRRAGKTRHRRDAQVDRRRQRRSDQLSLRADGTHGAEPAEPSLS